MAAEVTVSWSGPGLRLEGRVPEGHSIIMDHVLPGEDREETGIRPMRLVLLGMAGCTSMDVVSILQKKREALSSMLVSVAAERADDHPRVYTRAHLEFVVRGEGIDPKAVERAIELSVTKYCSAIAMIAKTAEITTSYRIEEGMIETKSDIIAELERRIAELKGRLPKHTPPMSMLVELDELDEALEEARTQAAQEDQA
jgi:putative redox protein